MTNADKIRNMSNEDLAKLFSQDPFFKIIFHPKYCELVTQNLNPGFCDDDCYECTLTWLNKEAKEKISNDN